MCGIVGYAGHRPAVEVVLGALRRLEYRGYDSAGIAVVGDTSELSSLKRAGKLAVLDAALQSTPLPEANTGIGHTRWATHGPPTDPNAHPHLDERGRVAVIHNGIIENFAELRAELESGGTTLASDTDTEVVAHMLGSLLDGVDGDLAEAMRQVCQRLTGAFTLVAVAADAPGRVVAARRNSPLVVGLGDGENFVGSDVSAFMSYTRDAMEVDDDQVIDLTSQAVTLTDLAGNEVTGKQFTIDWDVEAAEKGGYDYFMLKEIAEQPKAVADTLLGRLGSDARLSLDEMRLSDEEIRDIDKVIITACGTAFHAGLVAKYAIEHWTRIPCEVEMASEFRYRDPIVDRRTLVIAISQSGETMDTLMALRHARTQGARVLAICNTNGSTIPRESDAVLYTRAGLEIAVASTKAFLTQLVACYLVALYLGQVRGTKWGDEIAGVLDDVADLPAKVDQVLETMERVRDLARTLADAKSVLFIGRHVGYPVALEGALKLKEIAYMHAEGFPAGELKHGPIALIERGVPVFVIVPSPRGRSVLHDKTVSNIQEVRARGAVTVVVAEEGDEAVVPYASHLIRVPVTSTLLQPVVATVPLQVFACEMAALRGFDVDQPRNLAKSVTVE
jgi:glucosamine--fructose-6-phosphate aminotransferase (isomerizing)